MVDSDLNMASSLFLLPSPPPPPLPSPPANSRAPMIPTLQGGSESTCPTDLRCITTNGRLSAAIAAPSSTAFSDKDSNVMVSSHVTVM